MPFGSGFAVLRPAAILAVAVAMPFFAIASGVTLSIGIAAAGFPVAGVPIGGVMRVSVGMPTAVIPSRLAPFRTTLATSMGFTPGMRTLAMIRVAVLDLARMAARGRPVMTVPGAMMGTGMPMAAIAARLPARRLPSIAVMIFLAGVGVLAVPVGLPFGMVLRAGTLGMVGVLAFRFGTPASIAFVGHRRACEEPAECEQGGKSGCFHNQMHRSSPKFLKVRGATAPWTGEPVAIAS